MKKKTILHMQYMPYIVSILYIVLSSFFLLAPASCYASDGPQDGRFRKANTLYESQKYESALAMYKGLADKGVVSGNLYYNIGNSYFKLGRLGEAIVYYERASRLIPGDRDLRSNLKYAKSLTESVGQKSALRWYLAILENFSQRFSANGLTKLVLFLYLTLTLLLIIWVFNINPAPYRGGVNVRHFLLCPIIMCAIIFLFSGASLIRKIYVYETLRPSVVLSEAAARYGPSESSTEYFRLFEGNEVCILKERPGWYFIRRPDGRKGWIKSESLEII